MVNNMKITKRQLRRIIRESIKESVFDTKQIGGISNQAGIGRYADHRSIRDMVIQAWNDGRSTAEGTQVHGLVSELWSIVNEPEEFGWQPTKEQWVAEHAKYSPAIPQMASEWLWDFYVVQGKEL